MSNTVQLVYCLRCGWSREIEGCFVNSCPNCTQKGGLYFIRGDKEEAYEKFKKIMNESSEKRMYYIRVDNWYQYGK